MTAPEAPGPDPRPVEPLAAPPDATVALPGSKSITNRALVCAALARGRSTLDGALFADDTEAMAGGLRTLGVRVDAHPDQARLVVHGTGGELAPGPLTVDANLSGTTARFLLPALALGPGPFRLDGGVPLRRRPMADGMGAVAALGADVVAEGEGGHLPVVVQGGAGPGPHHLVVRGDASSQFLSGLLLVGPALPGGLTVEVEGPLVSGPYVAMTEAVMAAFGARVAPAGGGPGAPAAWRIEGGGYRAGRYAVEPDASAASYFFAAAAICGGRVRVEGLHRGSLQGDVAFVDVLARMGAEVAWEPDAVTVTGTGALRGVTADLGDLSDTAQTLAAVAVFADGPTEVIGIGFIRAKETDRIGAVVTELRRCGIGADETPDGFTVRPGTPRPTVVQTYDDHRMAMSFALLGLRVPGIAIADPGCVAKTFPGYFAALDQLRVQRH